MDLIAALGTAYEIHRTQMARIETELRRDSYLVEAEIPLPRDADWPHARIDIADFIIVRTIETGHERVEHHPVQIADTPPTRYSHAGLTVDIDALIWDRVQIETGGQIIEAAGLDAVLAKWHWDWGADTLPDAPGFIHSITLEPDGLHLDLGSAPPVAFLEIIETLGQQGINPIRITRDD